MRARRRGRPARRGRALRLAVSWNRPGRGEEPAHLRLRQRDGEPHPARSAAGAGAGAGDLAAAGVGEAEGGRMTAEALRESGRVAALDVERIRKDFPVLEQEVRGKPLVYLDSAATSQKPRAVIDAGARYYLEDNANVHRGVHLLSERATQAYEDAREKVRQFINAARAEEIVFVRGTTEAINLVAQTHGRSRVRAGDEVLITEMEHHSDIVPWQLLCQEKGAVLRVAPIDDHGQLVLEELERMLGPRTRLLALAHVSNTLGTVNPVRRIVEIAHRQGVPVLLDGAQAAPHFPIDVRALDCDFYAFSGHKLFGPTGIGVLYGKSELLEEMPPWQGGGDMISSVPFEKTTWNKLPHKFTAATPALAGTIGLGAAHA